MKKVIFSSLLAIASILIFSGCKKYDEGPALTLRSVKNRLTNGDWSLQELKIDGVDSTTEYKEIKFEYSFSASDDLGPREYSYTQSYTFEGQLIEINNGEIVFKDDGDVMVFYNSSYYYYYSALFSADSNGSTGLEWKIKKLTNKEFWLETTLAGMPVSMKLTKD